MASALKPLQTEDVPVNGPVNGPVGGPVPVPSFDGQGPTKGAINEHPRDKKFAYYSSYAYTYPSFYSYPYSSYSYSYSKPYYHPYAYGAYYPGFHYAY
ncbi:hypothetical protein V9T40_012943 [Parthenolecanium corni]|uniref:Uncharacterized protein n=1 Tax=Parthenolecanium corni TaxID=536013 RepID=A0AAN9TL90_9HEMI